MRIGKPVLASLLGIWVAGCGPEEIPTDGALPPEDEGPVALTVGGTARILPEAERVFAQRGTAAPPVGGLHLRLEDPLRVLVADPEAVLRELPIPDDGLFRAEGVSSGQVSVALSGLLFSEGSDAFVPFSTVLFDSLQTGAPLRSDLDPVDAFAVPVPFATILTETVGEPEIRDLTAGTWGTLAEAGFVVGRVLSADGQPVADARVVTLRFDGTRSNGEARIFYPTDDYAPLSGPRKATTRPNGLFIYVHTGGADEVLRLGIENRPEVSAYAVGKTGAGMWITLAPQPPG